MYLSKLQLNPRSRAVRNDLASPYELHRTLMRSFPDGYSKENRMLFRIEPVRENNRRDGVTVLIQTALETPDWTHLPEDYCLNIDGPLLVTFRTQEHMPIFTPGQHLAMRLVANPVRRRRKEGRPPALPGKERGHARYRREAIFDEEEQRQWLMRQGADGGFKPLFLYTSTFDLPRRHLEAPTHEDKKSIPHVGVRFDGLIEVTDPEKLITTLEKGIGPAKAFGFGLLSVARPM